jgi:flagellar basal body-associated protein FliL
MADKKDPAPAPATPAAEAKPAKKGLPIKVIGVVAGLMIAEAVGVYIFVSATGPRAQAAAAQTIKGEDQPDLDASVEVPLLEEKLQNMQTGRAWIWDTEIVLKVRTRNEAYVTKELEKRHAEIAEGVALIFRRSPHNNLKEPGLETINRQVTAYMNQVLGKDAEGKERLERVVIPKCKGFPAD